MRHRPTILGAALLALALAAGTAPAAGPPRPANRVLGFSICGHARRYTFLFGPHGRPGSEALGSFKAAVSQLGAYAGAGRAHPRSALVAVAAANGFARTGSGCTAFAPRLAIGFHGRSVVTRAAALVCTFHAPPAHELVRLAAGGIGYSAIERPRLQALYAQLTPTRSELRYDASFCRITRLRA